MVLPYVLLLLLAAIYGGLMLRFAAGFRKVLRSRVSDVADRPFVSVIVAARNEARSIERCVQGILANRYPAFELIVVDDFSEDGTAYLAERMAEVVPAGVEPDESSLRVLRLKDLIESNHEGKPGAIRAGIDAARGDVVLTTDADCVTGPKWIESMVSRLSPEIEFVSGPVLFEPGSAPAARLQALEFLGLVAVGAGAIGSGAPNMCNSANIMYRRTAYLRHVDDLPATRGAPPDEALLQVLHRENPGSVAFCPDLDAVVRTEPEMSPRSFIRQRRRWARTGSRYPSAAVRRTVGLVYAFYVVLLATATGLVFGIGHPAPVVAAVAIKLLGEATLLVPAATHFGYRSLLGYFLPAQLLQVPYVVGIGVGGVIGPLAWKDRGLEP